ncbi:hypothetical protein Tco_0961437 [Tanacetum coccineum]
MPPLWMCIAKHIYLTELAEYFTKYQYAYLNPAARETLEQVMAEALSKSGSTRSTVNVLDCCNPDNPVIIQDGKALPDAPVVISPYGLFLSLFREGPSELLKFHVLQGLESHGSIVRQSTISRKKEVCSKGEYTSGLDTNMIYLYHYAKQLGQLQRLEITKANKTFFDNENMEVALGNGVFEERIADFVHAIRAICDRLEKPKGM